MRYLEKKNAIRMISTRRVAERYPLHYLVWYNKYKELEKELSTKQVGDVCVCVCWVVHCKHNCLNAVTVIKSVCHSRPGN